jgi:hypothetical protein
MTLYPEPDPLSDPALYAAPLLNRPPTTTKAGNQDSRQTIATGITDPSHTILVGTDPVTAAAARSPTPPASTTPREAVPDPSPAGEPPVMPATDLRPTEAGTTRATTRATAAASAIEARREAGTGRDGNLSHSPASGWTQQPSLFIICQFYCPSVLVFDIALSSNCM